MTILDTLSTSPMLIAILEMAKLYTEDGELEVNTPRDRGGSFEPKIVKKRQTKRF